MRLYKYCSLASFERVLDIILNQRLYCSTYDSLNDPFEGLFLTTIHLTPQDRARFPLLLVKSFNVYKNVEDLIFGSIDKIRICSLSSSFSEVRLWSHYADGHKGIVFEIDFSGLESKIHKVNYYEELPSFGFSILTQPHPHEVLSCKTKHWEYEAEYRIFHESEFFDISNRIKGIYLGTRISATHYGLVTKVVPNKIPIYTTKINKRKILVELNKGVQK